MSLLCALSSQIWCNSKKADSTTFSNISEKTICSCMYIYLYNNPPKTWEFVVSWDFLWPLSTLQGQSFPNCCWIERTFTSEERTTECFSCTSLLFPSGSFARADSEDVLHMPKISACWAGWSPGQDSSPCPQWLWACWWTSGRSSWCPMSAHWSCLSCMEQVGCCWGYTPAAALLAPPCHHSAFSATPREV